MQRTFVERAQKGDRDAYATLAAAAIARLDATARLILRDPDSAKDAVQETLIRAWRELPTLRDPDRFDAWLHRCWSGPASTRRARPGGHRVDVSLADLDLPAPTTPRSTVAIRDELERGFARSIPSSAPVIVLHHYLDLPMPEVASALGIPLGTAKSRLNAHSASCERRSTPTRGRTAARERRPDMTSNDAFLRDSTLARRAGGPRVARLPRRGPEGVKPDEPDRPGRASSGAAHRSHVGRRRSAAATPRRVAVVGALLAALVAADRRSSVRPRVPPPFGLAANGPDRESANLESIVVAAAGRCRTASARDGARRRRGADRSRTARSSRSGRSVRKAAVRRRGRRR